MKRMTFNPIVPRVHKTYVLTMRSTLFTCEAKCRVELLERDEDENTMTVRVLSGRAKGKTTTMQIAGPTFRRTLTEEV
jgi:hypothetical protein